VHDIRFI